MSEVMRLVGKSLAPEIVLRELLGLNRGRVVLADFVGDIALQGLAARPYSQTRVPLRIKTSSMPFTV